MSELIYHLNIFLKIICHIEIFFQAFSLFRICLRDVFEFFFPVELIV